MASTLLPTKMEGTQGLEVGSRTWVDCVLHVTCLSWVPCVWQKLRAEAPAENYLLLSFIETLCVAEPKLGSLCATDVTLPSSLGSFCAADVKRRIS